MQELPEVNGNMRVTNFYCFGVETIERYMEAGCGIDHYMVLGSLRNGLYRQAYPNKPEKQYDLCFVSQYKPARFEESMPELQGESLISFLENPNEEERDVFVETGGLYGPWPSPDKHNVFCIKSNGKKLIFNETPKTWEFYNLKLDSEEKNNIYDENSEDVKNLKKLLINYMIENNIDSSLINTN